MNRLLITGFEGFLEHTDNPTATVIEALHETLPFAFDSLILPVEYGSAAQTLIAHIENTPADRIVLLGLAAGRKTISLEHHALNLNHSIYPDNAGVTPFLEPIEPHGPALYASTLPLKAWLKEAQSMDYPVTLSTDAGSYVCNDLFYRLRHRFPKLPIGFIHVPLFKDCPLATQTATLNHLLTL